MVGGATTMRVAVLLVVPVPPSVELTAPVVLFTVPAVVPVTVTVSVQLPPAAIVPPLRLMLVPAAVADGEPLHVLVSPFGVFTLRPPVSVSLNATPLSATDALGLVMVKVSVVVPFSGIEVAPKALLMVGGATTVSVWVPLLLELNFGLLALSPANEA